MRTFGLLVIYHFFMTTTKTELNNILNITYILSEDKCILLLGIKIFLHNYDRIIIVIQIIYPSSIDFIDVS